MNGPRPAAPASSPERQLQTDLDGLNLTTDQMLHEVSAFLFEYPIGRQSGRAHSHPRSNSASELGRPSAQQPDLCTDLCTRRGGTG